MSGWESYRAWELGELVGELVVQGPATDGLQPEHVRVHDHGVELVILDLAPADPDGESDGWTRPSWQLTDDVGTSYQLRRGGMSGNRHHQQQRHSVHFSPAVSEDAAKLSLTDGTRQVVMTLSERAFPASEDA